MTRPPRPVLLALLALGVGAGVAVASGGADIGGRLGSGRPEWILLAAGFEVASALGFVAIFQLVFGHWLPPRTSLRTGLTVLAATILIPAGGRLAVVLGARALRGSGITAAATRSRAVAFLLITNAPNLIALGVLGAALGAGLLDGPHSPILTVLPAAIALSAIGMTALIPAISHRRVAPVSPGSRSAFSPLRPLSWRWASWRHEPS